VIVGEIIFAAGKFRGRYGVAFVITTDSECAGQGQEKSLFFSARVMLWVD